MRLPRIITPLFLVIMLVSLCWADPQLPKGIYSLTGVMKPIRPSILRLPFITGISLRASWQDLEPEEGKYNFSYLEQNIQTVSMYGKNILILVLPGFRTPSWVRTKSVSFIKIQDENPRRIKSFGRSHEIPVPWDKNYLELWCRFVKALAEKYASHQEVVLIHLAGPTVYSAEMHLPKKQNRKITSAAGYHKDKIVSAWKEVIDVFDRSFKNKAMALNVSIPFEHDEAMEDIIRYARRTLGRRFCIQGDWLHDQTKITYEPFRTIYNLKDDENVTVGFQMLCPATNKGGITFLERTVKNGLNAGAHYFEMYPCDLIQKEYHTFFIDLQKNLLAK